MFPYSQSLVDIPSIFHSVEFGGPFQQCQICTRNLMADNQPYMIEKVFRGPETIIEMATCLTCSLQVQSEMSQESQQTLQREFHGKVDWGERLQWLESDGEPLDSQRWLSQCVITGNSKDEVRNFQIGGMFIGDQMALSVLPYMISAEAVEQIGEQLSEETRGYMQDFVGDQFGMPPEFCHPDSPLPILI